MTVLGIDVGRDENGKRKRIFKSGFRLEGDADNELIMSCVASTHQFLAKPCDPDALKATVRVNIGRDNQRFEHGDLRAWRCQRG